MDAEDRLRATLLSKGRARRHDPEAEHGGRRQEIAEARFGRRGRRENGALAQGLRAAGGAGNRIPLRRPVRRGGDGASRCHEQDRRPAVEAHLLLWPRLAGGAAKGLVRQGGKRRGRATRVYASRAHERARHRRPLVGGSGKEGGLTQQNKAAPRARLMLVTPPVDDAAAFSDLLWPASTASDIAAVIARFSPASDAELSNRARTLLPRIQGRDIAFILEATPVLPCKSAPTARIFRASRPFATPCRF